MKKSKEKQDYLKGQLKLKEVRDNLTVSEADLLSRMASKGACLNEGVESVNV